MTYDPSPENEWLVTHNLRKLGDLAAENRYLRDLVAQQGHRLDELTEHVYAMQEHFRAIEAEHAGEVASLKGNMPEWDTIREIAARLQRLRTCASCKREFGYGD